MSVYVFNILHLSVFSVPLIYVATNSIFSMFNMLGIYKLVVKGKAEVPNWLI